MFATIERVDIEHEERLLFLDKTGNGHIYYHTVTDATRIAGGYMYGFGKFS